MSFLKRYRGWFVLLALAALCIGGVRLALHLTAEYPPLGETVSYPVNQIEGFDLSIEDPTWSPFRGYTIRWTITADSDEVYTYAKEYDEPDPEYLERLVNGQWHRLGYCQENANYYSMDDAMGGGEYTGHLSSFVQKYNGYGTRLEPGTYRLTVQLRDRDGAEHYLAAEFAVD